MLEEYLVTLLDAFSNMNAHLPQSFSEYRQATDHALQLVVARVLAERELTLLLLRDAPTVDGEMADSLEALFAHFADLARHYLEHAVRLGIARPCRVEWVPEFVIGWRSACCGNGRRARSPSRTCRWRFRKPWISLFWVWFLPQTLARRCAMATMKGKRVLVTGAGAGIGACLAAECAKAGARLLLADLRRDALEEQAAKLRAGGADVSTYVLDISKREEVQGLYEFAKSTFGGLDVLVNNAGIGHSGEMAETSLETWQRLMDVNFWGPLYLTYAFLPDWLAAKKGHLVNVSSGQAFFRLPTWGPYSVVKLALGAFSELLGVELRGAGITVTTVYPFMVNTGFYKGIAAETFGAKLSMKLMPYYSMSPCRPPGGALARPVKAARPASARTRLASAAS